MGRNRETAPSKPNGKHGGNRAGGTKRLEKKALAAGSRQSAGNDPARGKKAQRQKYN